MTDLQQQLKSALSHAYEIERELPGAGMSRVFVAVERALGRRVVIKVLPPELAAGVNNERFRREIQLSAQLNHPHIVPVLASGEIGEMLYYTMPYMEGESLNFTVERGGPLGPAEVVRIMHDVVDAIAYAHSRGVIHRDIKPANILTLGNHSLVTDFGVAKAISAAMPSTGMTSGGFAIGTPAYMAPEQLAGDPQADHRVDIYAAGLLAYELLTGTSPFTGTSPQATMAAQLTRVPEPLRKVRPDVPAALSDIIQRCLDKLPENRPNSAQELLRELDAVATPQGAFVTARPSLGAVLRNPAGHVRYAAGLAGASIVFALSLYGLGAFLDSRSREFRSAEAATVGATGAQVDAPGGVADRDQLAVNALFITGDSPIATLTSPATAAPAVTEADLAAFADSLRRQFAIDMRRDADSLENAIERRVLDSLTQLRNAGRGGGPPGSRQGGSGNAGRGNLSELRRPPPPGERRVLVTNFFVSLGGPDTARVGVALADSLRRSIARQGGYRGVSSSAARETARSDDIRVMVDRVHASAVVIGYVQRRGGDSAVVRLLFSEPARTQQPRPLGSVVRSLTEIAGAIDSLVPMALTALGQVNWPSGRQGSRSGGGGSGRSETRSGGTSRTDTLPRRSGGM